MTAIHVMLWFDTEDYITHEAEDALLGLLTMLNSRKIKGIFKIVGEKARKLERNTRADILKQLMPHEIGYHTNFHSLHPTVSEYSEKFGFAEGAQEFEWREREGLDDVTRITGMTSKCYGQPGYSWAPQSFPALRKWGIPVYLDVHDQITLDNKPFWYGGMLNLTDIKGIMRMELTKNGLQEGIREFDRMYDMLMQENGGFISIYYHPCEFACTGFWDGVNYNHGQNTPRDQWQPAPLRQAGEMEAYIEMLGSFLDYTLSKPNVAYITSEEALHMEKSNRTALEASDVRALAAATSHDLTYQVYNGYSLSASDLHSLFCKYLLGEDLVPELIYGPEHEVESDRSVNVDVSAIIKAISVEYPRVLAYKQLPDYFTVAGFRINPVDLTCTLASIISKELNDVDRVEMIAGALKPKMHARTDECWGPKWSPFPQDLKVPNLVRQSQLQTWTLKPAIF
ncbi:hypothetical protein [Paenibacillus montanisoli]|uniref:NodB homology domain-containing protein n=1 Tax=Paenibacillus montanisoli TaxID=2081970 RepID=A0A328U1B6_9BACL|nr:hypothetical protein [Paenibacillus montanisoli]RAP76557.1 hypothetical protein DL346_14385 [Paenibacillus montanisoli]